MKTDWVFAHGWILLATLLLTACGGAAQDASNPTNRSSGDADSDGDGLSDQQEASGWEVVVDASGFSRAVQEDTITRRNVTSDASQPDSDSDGINDLDEFNARSDPRSADTDGDGWDDAQERAAGTDPTKRDTDVDGLPDACEQEPLDKASRITLPSDLQQCRFAMAYVVNGNSDIGIFSVDAGNGALLEIDGSPYTGTDSNTVMVAIDPSGRFAYGAAGRNGAVTAYDVNPDTGMLSPNPYEQIDGGSALQNWSSVAAGPDGKFVFATDQGPDNDKLVGFAIDDGSRPGKLLWVESERSVSAPEQVVVGPMSRFVFSFGASQTIGVYAIDPQTDPASGDFTDILKEVAGSPFSTPQFSDALAAHPSGGYLFSAATNAALLSVYSVSDTGVLAEVVASRRDAVSPAALAVHPTGKFVYAAGAGFVAAYRFDETTGALSHVDADPLTPGTVDYFPTGASPKGLAVDPSGLFLYVATADGVALHRVDPDSGFLLRVDADGDPLDGNLGSYGRPATAITVMGLQ